MRNEGDVPKAEDAREDRVTLLDRVIVARLLDGPSRMMQNSG